MIRRPFAMAAVSAMALASAALAQEVPGAPPPAVGPGGPPGPPPAVVAAAAAKPTPKASDGNPDLTGLWGVEASAFPVQRVGGSINIVGPDVGTPRQAVAEAVQKARQTPFAPAAPPYKPEHRALIQKTYDEQDKLDPVFYCAMPGVPRLGPPQQIVQTAGQVVFLYTHDSGDTFRVVPTDGRAFRDDVDPSKNGDSVGRWEGGTLVVEARNFVPDTWLGDGYLHSDKMRVVERLTRAGDTLKYEVTVEDPEMLSRPWVRQRTLLRLSRPLEEALPCMDTSGPNLLNNDHH